MNTVVLSVLGLIWSLAGLAVLTRYNRLRQRQQRVEVRTLPKSLRGVLWILAISPGALYIALGEYSALTNWGGGVTIVGLLVTFLLPVSTTRTR